MAYTGWQQQLAGLDFKVVLMAHTGPQQQLAGSFPRESESLLFHVRKILDRFVVVSLCGGNGFSGGGFFKGRSEVGWSMVGWWWLVCRSFPVSSLPILHSRGHWVAWQCVFFWRQFSSPDVALSYPVDGWSVTRLDPMGMMACTFSPREMSKSTFVDWGVTSSRLVNPPFISMLGVRVLVSRAGCWHSPVVSPQDWRGRATLKWQNVSLDISDRSIGSPPTWPALSIFITMRMMELGSCSRVHTHKSSGLLLPLNVGGIGVKGKYDKNRVVWDWCHPRCFTCWRYCWTADHTLNARIYLRLEWRNEMSPTCVSYTTTATIHLLESSECTFGEKRHNILSN